jgi:hypothetical protein
MNTEKEIQALSAETLAFSIMLGSVLSKLAKDPTLRFTITQAFNEAADVAQSVAVRFGKSASPEHTVKALRIIEEMRAMVLGDENKPKSFV